MIKKFTFYLLLLVGLGFNNQANAQTACTDIVIPDVITPNGDGINDLLIITCIENYPDNELTVYSRWGEIVYHAIGYSNNWDGYAEKNKSPLPNGTYVFILKAKMNGEEKQLTGNLTITR
ncbi:MAG: gliding motility-associated C-terminal domain-containing protein [Bacteroidetes bacterium]|nr:gliding motility-associated C-terminal domain-containing protein [Bacteroidota bacterium]